jgi:hypothetical protein
LLVVLTMWLLFTIFAVTVLVTTARALRDYGNPPVERLGRSDRIARITTPIPAPAPVDNWRDYYVRN